MAACSVSSRMLSTPVWEAASISITSKKAPLLIARQFSHSLHGSAEPSARLRQLRALATSLATEVLPVPRGPANK